jgi:hypothetical protein
MRRIKAPGQDNALAVGSGGRDRPLRAPVKVPTILIVLAFLVCGVVTSYLITTGRTELAFQNAAVRVQAEIVAIRQRTDPGAKDGPKISHPVLRYKTADGQIIDAELNEDTNSKAWAVGQPVWLLYDPIEPMQFEVDTVWRRWGSKLILSVVALGFLGASILGLRSRGWRLF